MVTKLLDKDGRSGLCHTRNHRPARSFASLHVMFIERCGVRENGSLANVARPYHCPGTVFERTWNMIRGCLTQDVVGDLNL